MSRPAEPALLERGPELERLARLLESAAAGRGGTVLIEGEAGSGKSRLLEAARATAEDAGLLPLRARGAELERRFVFGVVRQLFEPLIRGEGVGTLLRGAAALPEPAAEAPVHADELGAFHGIYWLCANLADAGQACLLVDDAHWADGSSLRFLGFLSRRVDELPLAVVVAARGEDQADLIALQAEAEQVRLAPLSEGAVAVLVRDALGDADAAFCDACATATGGNPFLLRELLREVRDRAVAPNVSGAGAVASLGPEEIARVALGRLESLEPTATDLAYAAATLGDGSELREVARLAAVDPSSAQAAADALAAADVLADERPLRFLHPIIGASVPAAMPAGERARLHERAATLLLEDGAPPERVAAQLLETEPACVPGAAMVLDRAARAALAGGVTDAAIAYWERAVQEPNAPEAQAELTASLGSAELAAGRAGAIDRLLEGYEGLADPEAHARLAPELVRALLPENRVEEAVALLDAAAEGVRSIDPTLAGDLLTYGATVVHARPELPLVTSGRLERLERLAERQPRSRVERIALSQIAHRRMDDGAQAVVAGELAERALGDGHEAAEAPVDFVAALVVLALAGRLEPFLRVIERIRSSARERGAPVDFAFATAFRAQAELRCGALAEAEADAREALGALEPGSWQVGPALGALVEALVERGETGQAERELTEAGFDDNVPDFRPFTPLLIGRGRLRLAAGQTPEGLADLIAVLARLDAGRGSSPAGLDVRVLLARTYLTMGDAGAARAAARDAGERAQAWGTSHALGLSEYALGLLEGGAAGRGRLKASAALLADSPARLDRARALIALGAALRRANQRADARAPLREALALARACGAGPVAAEAEEELRATGARPRSVVRTGVDALTPSERRIADRAAGGASNRELAQSLFVTVKTIEMHLSNVYRKLEISSRHELPRALDDDQR